MFKINTESELVDLLRIVSEEAVKKTKKTLNENKDPAQDSYMKNLKASEGMYSVDLTEQEDAAEDATEEEVEEPPAEETESNTEKEPIDPETFGVSFDSVVKDINTLRAGRSTKDKEIKDELLGYYDRLDGAERKILHLFLSELSKILQGAIVATDAQDPSEPPFGAEITFPGEEESPEKESPDSKQRVDDVPDEEEEESQEDTSPPIKVNERQELNEIRKKVYRLMKRY